MSYTVCNVLDLGEAYTGVTLNAQLYDASNSTVGSAITTGFYERAGSKGIYSFTLTVPDGHQGWFDVYVQGASSNVLATLPINPAELENADVKTSTRSTFAGGAVASVTGDVGGNVVGSIGSLATQAKADVNAETDTALADAGVTTTVTGRIDAAVSSRLASAGYTTPPTVAAIRTEMDSNSTKLANLDATVSSRAPSSTALSTAQWTNGRAANLDNLDAAVSTRLPTSSYTAPTTPPTVTAIRQEMDTNSAKLANLDAAITTRATPGDVSNAQTAIADAIDALNDITAADVVTALMAYAVESGKDYATVLRETYAILRGKYEADDADPTSVVYYAPDGATERVTFALTDTTRTPS